MNTKLLTAFLAVMLSTGCVVVGNDDDDGHTHNPPPPAPAPAPVAYPGDVTFHWTLAGYSCQQTPDVHSIRVVIDGEMLENGGIYSCLVNGYPGIVLHDFDPGSYTFTLQGLGGSNEVLFERAGTFAVNGHVDVTVSLDAVASYAYLSWRLPETGTHTNPTCTQAGVSFVDVWIDGVDEGRFFCSQGQSGSGVPTRYLGLGEHTITLLAVDEYGYPLYRFDGPLIVQGGMATSAHYHLQWAVGGAGLKWQLTNGPIGQTCAQAGVTRVWVNFLDEDGQWVYPGAGDEQDCNLAWVAYDYLQPGTYQVFVQAMSNSSAYESDFQTPPTVTVHAGHWTTQAEALNVMVYRQ